MEITEYESELNDLMSEYQQGDWGADFGENVEDVEDE